MAVTKMIESLLVRRDVVADVKSAPQTFSSWDNCMQKAYCKWPAIIGILIASLIVFSIVWCLVRCLCCGVSCCCSCLSCCDFCSRGDRRGRSRYADGPAPFQNAHYQGYQPAPAPPHYEPPSYAQFDAPSKGGKYNGDALPAMPSWDQASSRKVEDTSHDQDVELAHLENKTGQLNGTISHQGTTRKGGYSQVDSNPPTPQNEYPSGYRGSEITNPYNSPPTAYGLGAEAGPGVIGATYTRPSLMQGQHAIAHEKYSGQSYERMSPPAAQGNFGYGHGAHNNFSPHQETPPAANNQSYSSYNSQEFAPPVPGTLVQRDYAQYGHSASPLPQQGGNRPPSLLQPGKPAGQTWREA